PWSGLESVDQLTQFDRALRDFSAIFLIWEVTGDRCGSLSMTYVTGQPIIFVGCGQLRKRETCNHCSDASRHS
ncbi:hypothetical protein MPER_07291, partial [Moniliophthora perniciosa FA553]